MLHDSTFWVLLATLLFVIIVATKGRAAILSKLDLRTAKIRSDLDEAAFLRSEAEKLLADMQFQYSEAIETSQKIINTAKESAARMTAAAESKNKESLERRENQLMERIARAEATAVQELRTQAADLAARSAEILLQEAMSKRGAKLVDESIADISAKAS